MNDYTVQNIPEYEKDYEVWQDDIVVASSQCEWQGRHYLDMYKKYGPAVLTETVITRKVLDYTE